MSDITEKVSQEYDASQIQVLEGLEAVRKRPGMYIGSTSSSGLHHLVYEIVDNSIDEALAGYCTHIEVDIEEGDIIRVSDNGRGIPVDIQEQTGKSALEVVFTVLHAGGKFGGGGYKVSGGLHGVGASVVNALSEWLEVQVHKDGKIHQMRFSRGDILEPIHVVGETDRTGTTVRFKPDPEMFDDTVYDYEILHTRMREQAFLNGGLTITLEDQREGRENRETMCYEGGIREFVRYLNKHKSPIHEEVIYLSGSKGDAIAEVALQYNDSYNDTIVSFANDIHTPEGGMHETGFKTALTRVINAYGQKNNIIKGDDKVSGEDVREGIAAVISVKLPEAQFEGQTKQKFRGASGHGQGHSGEGHDGQPGPRGRPQGQGVRPPQDRTGERADARQAPGLQRAGSLPVRAVHRRGRFRRRLRHPGPRQPLPGDPGHVGQDAERGKGPGR